jgi:predicted metal-binding membrane protein
MLLLFAGGVMKRWWIGALTAFVLLEKLARHPHADVPVDGLRLQARIAAVSQRDASSFLAPEMPCKLS